MEVDHTIHDQLAMKLCTEALRYPDSSESKVYLKALLQLSMSFSNPSHTRDLYSLTRKLMRNVKDRSSVRLVEQFDALVRSHLVPASGDSAESTADDAEMEVDASTAESIGQNSPMRKKPRIRQLGSKHGTTLLMEVVGSDTEGSQSSDVFFSPQISSTQTDTRRDKTSSEECVIEVDSR